MIPPDSQSPNSRGKPAKTRVKCPACKKTGEWFAGPYGPFCSHRCKMVDLGKWLGEEHRLVEPLREEHLEEGN
jgi:hypothetical protein